MSRRAALALLCALSSCAPEPASLDRSGPAYGVIINGDDDPETAATHRENVEEAALFLEEVYGVAPERLTVLSVGRGKPPTPANIRAAAAALSAKLEPRDLLVLYTTGHGERPVFQPALALPGGAVIGARALPRLFLANRAGEVVYLGDQCHSGGFARALSRWARLLGKRVVAVAATDAANETFCQSFVFPYFDAFYDKKNDRDGDGVVSEREAFEVARAAHQAELKDTPEQANAQFYAWP